MNGQETEYDRLRQRMVREQLEDRDITDERVLDAMSRVPRHLFVPLRYAGRAYEDRPLPIGHQQTISQPYIVAYMIEIVRIASHERVLEIGTGSGYQAAILGELAREVFTVEIVAPLGERAREVLKDLHYANVHVRIGDGYQGWARHAPYDAIIVAAAAAEVPQPLIDQLAEGGRMIIPVGHSEGIQFLTLYRKYEGKVRQERLVPVRFVPFTREMPRFYPPKSSGFPAEEEE